MSKKRVNPDNDNDGGRSKKAKTSSFDILDQLEHDIATDRAQDDLTLKHTREIRTLLNEALESIKQTQDNDNLKIEVEARLGQYSTKKFVAGVQTSEFEALRSHFDQQSNLFSYILDEEDYLYPIKGQKGSYRVTMEGETPVSGIIKVKDKEVSLQFGDKMPYDARINIAREIEANKGAIVNLNPNQWEICRKKQRYSYEVEEYPIRIDLTEVTSIQNNQPKANMPSNPHNTRPSKVTHEIEFELTDRFLEWMSEEKNSLELLVQTFYELITDSMKVLNSSKMAVADHSVIPFTEIKTAVVTEENLLKTLKVLLRKALGLDVLNDFPGSMPVTLSRKHIRTIQSNKYYVSDKTDGLRYMLLVCSEGSYFIDRKFSFFKIKEFDSLMDLFAQNDTTSVIDGELIRHETTKVVTFLVFDLIQVNGEDCCKKSLTERLRLIGEKIVLPYRTGIDKGLVPEKHPFSLVGKKFMEKKNIASLLRSISKKDAEGNRFYKDERRHHKTDGFIFTPDDPYTLRATHNLFKWKYSDKQSIDFKVRRFNSNSFSMYIQIQGGEAECFQVTFSPEDKARLESDWEIHRKGSDEAIIEVTYDKHVGEWKYHTMRHDKKTANYIRIAWDTMTSLLDDITPEELHSALVGRSGGGHTGGPGPSAGTGRHSMAPR